MKSKREEIKPSLGYTITTTIIPQPYPPVVLRTCSGAVLEL
ncbi:MULTISPECIES: hypothetical protein [Odoribacteraceae]|nr:MULTISPECIES: hypothetical protein [Odoribacteraceae]MCQ4875092.1 hypothetical protein [Butyricimonas paravirosa]